MNSHSSVLHVFGLIVKIVLIILDIFCRYNLGTFYFATNYFAKAKYQFQGAYNTYKAFLAEDHPDTQAAQKALEALP